MKQSIGIGEPWPKVKWAKLEVKGSRLSISRGAWPTFGGQTIAISKREVTLPEGVEFIYLDWDGSILLSEVPLGYGIDLAGQQRETADLLAWWDGSEWQIKELVDEREVKNA